MMPQVHYTFFITTKRVNQKTNRFYQVICCLSNKLWIW